MKPGKQKESCTPPPNIPMTSARARDWCFTLFDRRDEEEGVDDQLRDAFESYNIAYLVAQEEQCPTTGRFHIQGYCRFRSARTLRGLKRLAFFEGAHLEIAQGNPDQNRAYCTKEDTRVAGPWEFGELPPCGQGTRTDLNDFAKTAFSGESRDLMLITRASVFAKHFRWANAVCDLASKAIAQDNYRSFVDPADKSRRKTVCVLWGEPGTGKTSWVVRTFGMENIFRLVPDGSGEKVWFDSYNGESVLLLDDFFGNIPHSALLQILDVYPFRAAVKGSFTYVNFEHIFITSNDAPNTWYADLYCQRPNLRAALRRRITLQCCFDVHYGKYQFVMFCLNLGVAPDGDLRRTWSAVVEAGLPLGQDLSTEFGKL